MIKRILKRIFVFAVIACLILACVPSVAFADVVEFTEAAKMGATIVDLYGAVNNTSLAYEAMTDGSALTVIETLYQDYSSSAGDPYTLAAIGAAAAAAGCIAVVYDAITGKGYVQLYQAQYIESLDGFWDYTLGDLGLSRNLDGLFEWQFNQNDEVVPLVVTSVPGSFDYQPIPFISGNSSTAAYVRANGFLLYQADPNLVTPGYDTCCVLGRNSSSPIYFFCYPDGSSTKFVACSNVSGLTYWVTQIANNQLSPKSITTFDNSSGLYYNDSLSETSSVSNYNNPTPLFASLSSGLSGVATIFSGNPNPGLVSASLLAYPEFYVGDPLTAQRTITIPDPASPQYVPSPSRINTDIEWLPEWGNPLPDGVEEPVPGVPYPVTDPAILNDAVPEIWKSVVQGVQTDPGSDPDPDPDPDPEPGPSPSEVFTPLLPVTLPSFNFSFSGIWHYVREWVASLGAWFTTLFTIWSALPYAMVVPVYATAVVVIVLGVYKRFFM